VFFEGSIRYQNNVDIDIAIFVNGDRKAGQTITGKGANDVFVSFQNVVVALTSDGVPQDITVAISKGLNMSMLHAEKLKRTQGLSPKSDGKDIEKVALLTLDYVFSEANRVLLNYQKKYNKNIAEVALSGGGALMKGVMELAERHLKTNVRFGDPFSRVESPAFLEQILKEAGASFVVAMGLALRKLGEQ